VANVLIVLLVAGFTTSGLMKLRDRAAFIRTLASVPWIAPPLARRLAVALPAIELVLALALVVKPAPAAAAAFVLLTAFTAVIAGELLAGRRFECRCFGALSAPANPAQTIARNLLLLTAAAGVALSAAPALELGQVLVGLAAFLALMTIESGVAVTRRGVRA
jgi:hypothetical protein